MAFGRYHMNGTCVSNTKHCVRMSLELIVSKTSQLAWSLRTLTAKVCHQSTNIKIKQPGATEMCITASLGRHLLLDDFDSLFPVLMGTARLPIP